VNTMLAESFNLPRVDIGRYLCESDAVLQRDFPGFSIEMRVIVNHLNILLGASRGSQSAVPDMQHDDLTSDYHIALRLQEQEQMFAQAARRPALDVADDEAARWVEIFQNLHVGSDAAAAPAGPVAPVEPDEAMSHVPLAQAIAEATGAPRASYPAQLSCPRSQGPFVDPYTTREGITVNVSALQGAERAHAVRDHAMRSLVDTWATQCHNEHNAYQRLYECLCCPITRGLMRRPVLAADGMVYEHAAISSMVGRPSPMVREIQINDRFIDHRAIAALTRLPQIQRAHAEAEAELQEFMPLATADAPAQSALMMLPARLGIEPISIAPELRPLFVELAQSVVGELREAQAVDGFFSGLRFGGNLSRALDRIKSQVDASPRGSNERLLALRLRVELLRLGALKTGYRQALADLDEIAASGSQTPFDLQRRGLVFCRLGRHAEAMSLVNLAQLEVLSDTPEGCALLGELARKRHLFQMACAFALQSHLKEPNAFAEASLNKTLNSMRARGMTADGPAALEETHVFFSSL
ncbi:MAG: hypothetical protein EOO40_07990, partial [Deltaproteobacteria bacterium]